METAGKGMKWLGRKLWLLVRVLGFMMMIVLSDAILEVSTSQWAQWGAALLSVGILVLMYWRAEKNGITIWDRSFLTWKGLGLVVLTFTVAQLFNHLGITLWNFRGLKKPAMSLN